jgi:Domain of Unknown Function with PDB structure (DUF3857)/Transglutaminase-like superfamily
MKRALPLAVLCFAATLHAAPTAPPWVQTAAAEKLPDFPKDTNAVVLLDETIVTVLPSSEVQTQHRRAVRVLTPAGKGYAYGVAGFDNNTKLRGLQGWSIEPSGKVHRMKERHAIESSAADFEVYTDAKMKILDLPAEVGSVIAYEYTLREKPYEPITVWRFQESIPVRRTRFQATVPDGWKHEVTWTNYAAAQPVNGMWELLDVPPIKDEPRMPEASSLAGRMGVQWISPATPAKRTWNDIARWYNGLAVPRLAPTPQIQQQVRTLTDSAPDPIRALARFTQLDIRYVAVAIGIGGYQPHASADIFTNRYGDCKDKATLLQTMLREKGITSHYVIVNTTRGMVDPSFPTITAFNHVISAIRIPKEKAKGLPAAIEHPQFGTLLLFDPTSTTTPFGHLPSYLQGSRGLLVTSDGGELIDLPLSVPEANELRRVAKLKMDDTGTLRGTVEETRTGEVAAEMRRWLQPLNGKERVQALESALSRSLAHYQAAGMTIEQLDDPEPPLVVKYEITVPNYANRVADMILIRPRVIGAKGENMVELKERQYGYVTDGVSLHTDEVEIALPAAIKLDELPKPVTLTTPYIQYTSSSGFENGVLRYKRRYAMQTHAVSREAIAELNAAFSKIGADERASAVFK